MQKKNILRIAIVLAVAVIAVLLSFYHEYFEWLSIRDTVRSFGIWAPVVFMLFYIVAALFFVPATALAIVGGLLFGFYWGAVYSFISAVIGCTLSFCLARYVASDWVKQKAGPSIQRIVKGAQSGGVAFVAFVRLAPWFNYGLINYVFGITAIKTWRFLWSSALFMLPNIVIYAYIGSLGEVILRGNLDDLIIKSVIALGSMSLVAALAWYLQREYYALKQLDAIEE